MSGFFGTFTWRFFVSKPAFPFLGKKGLTLLSLSPTINIKGFREGRAEGRKVSVTFLRPFAVCHRSIATITPTTLLHTVIVYKTRVASIKPAVATSCLAHHNYSWCKCSCHPVLQAKVEGGGRG